MVVTILSTLWIILPFWLLLPLIFAQDPQQRHVAIKVVNGATHEYDILRFLFEQGIPQLEDEFNHVIPILDILPFGEFWFAVMPRFEQTIGVNRAQVSIFTILADGGAASVSQMGRQREKSSG
ncbi:hypothetical protein DXG01_001683 [Tephrocybe rancida]|nr:hypothetical protein DXG01_001683 [Tephrocybe rancida]